MPGKEGHDLHSHSAHRCSRFEDLLIASLDRELTRDEVREFLSHQLTCPSGRHSEVRSAQADMIGGFERVPADDGSDLEDRSEEATALTAKANLPEPAGRPGSVPMSSAVEACICLERFKDEGDSGLLVAKEFVDAFDLWTRACEPCERQQAQKGKGRISLSGDRRSDLSQLLHKSGVRKEGHVKFFRGCRVGTFFEFGAIVGSPEVVDELKKYCVEAFLDSVREARPGLIVGHTEFMYEVAKSLCTHLGIPQSHALLALGGDRPFLCVPGYECRGRRVAILVDVVLSGTLLENLYEQVENHLDASVVFLGCLVKQGYSGALADDLHFLLEEEPDEYLTPCPRCAGGEKPSVFDHSGGMLLPSKPFGEIDSEVRQNIELYGNWWKWIGKTGALVTNKRLGGYSFEIFIDILLLLDDPDVRSGILEEAKHALSGMVDPSSWVFVYRLGANTRPMRVATALQELFGVEICPVEEDDNFLWMSAKTRSVLKGRKVLIVDAAVNSGHGISAISRLARDAGAVYVAAFVLINRLCGHEAMKMIERGLDREIVYLFPFPFRAVRTPVGVLEMYRKRSLDLNAHPVVREMCQGRIRRGSVRRPKAVQEELSASRAKRFRNLWECAMEGNQERVVVAADWDEIRAAFRMLPSEWSEYPHVVEALSALTQNGIDHRTLETVCVYLASVNCFDWLGGNWLTRHLNVLEEEGERWRFVALCLEEATRGGGRLKAELRTEIEGLLSSERSRPSQLLFPLACERNREVGLVEERLEVLRQIVVEEGRMQAASTE